MDEEERINAALEQNTNIQQDMKKLVKEVFGDIFTFLGDRGFKRFLLQRNIEHSMKTLIYRTVTEEEKEAVVARTTDWRGYANKKEIVLKDPKERDALTHEIFHTLNDDGFGGFNIFYGEGITEYLNILVPQENKSPFYSYVDNVNVIQMLHYMYGDGIIRDYLRNRGDKFFEDIIIKSAPMLSNEEISRMRENFKIADEQLVEYHRCTAEDEYNDDRRHAVEALNTGKNALKENYFFYLKSQIRQFEYMKDGKVDFSSFFNEVGTDKIHRYLNGDQINDLSIELIENSHLLYGKEGEEREQLKQNIIQDMQDYLASLKKDKETGKWGFEGKFNQDREPYLNLNQDVDLKMAKMFLSPDNFKENASFVDIITRVNQVARATNMDETNLPYILSKLSLDMCVDDPKRYFQIAERCRTVAQGIEGLKREYDENSEIPPTYRRISLDALGEDLSYIEQKGEEYSIISLDEETGKIHRLPLERYGGIGEKEGTYSHKISTVTADVYELTDDISGRLKRGNNVYQIADANGSKKSYIGFNEDITDIGVSGGSISPFTDQNKLLDFEDVKEQMISRVALSDIRQGIKEGRYSDIQPGASSAMIEGKGFLVTPDSPRTIDSEAFIQDYETMKMLIPGVDSSQAEKTELSQMLVDRTLKRRRMDEKQARNYEQNKAKIVEELHFSNKDGIGTRGIDIATKNINRQFLSRAVETIKAQARTGAINEATNRIATRQKENTQERTGEVEQESYGRE